MDIQSLSAVQNYTSARPATEATRNGMAADSPVGTPLKAFAEILRHGEEAALASMTPDADPHAMVQALTQTELAVETAVTVRDKVVEAYQEILRMPV